MPNNWLPIPHRKQSRPGACLPACAQMVLAYLDDDRSEAQLSRAMDTYWYGVPASRITRLTSWGYRVTYEQTTLAQLHNYLANQIPCIIFLRTGALPNCDIDTPHAVVLAGLTSDTAYIHDPARESGPTAIELNAFLLAWSDMDHYSATIQRG
jgi:ABC-type bacteriocin/lantibiotic exporter with double-glycine peptidase domain